MKLTRIVALPLSLALALALCGCSRRGAEPSTLRFGVMLSLSGAAAPYGNDNLSGLELAKEVLNEQGGVDGLMIELDVEDTAGEPSQAVTLARRFASDTEIAAILGPTRTGSTVAVSKVLPELQIVAMSVGSTGDWKSAVGEFNEWTFRSTRVDTHLIGPLLTTAKERLGVQRVAIIYTADDDWSVSVLDVYEREIERLGLELVAKESQMTGDTDRSAQLTKIAAEDPDALIINTLSSDAPTIADAARQRGIRARFLGTAGFTNPDTWSLAGEGVLNGTLVAENFYPGDSRPVVRQFVDRYRERFGKEPPPYAAYAYDGLLLVAEACRLSQDPRNRQQVRDSLSSLSNFEGLLGVLTYKGSGDAVKEPVILEIGEEGYSLVER